MNNDDLTMHLRHEVYDTVSKYMLTKSKHEDQNDPLTRIAGSLSFLKPQVWLIVREQLWIDIRWLLVWHSDEY